jgi:DNA repair exonuclease SbcCD ATPase subunit
MSLTLTRIELSNLRSHKSIKFEPESTGITAISGPNGSGKSTLVDSVGWCLYSEKPNGVSRVASLIREGTDLSKEKCFARVELKLDRTDLLIERRIVSLSGASECDVWEKVEGEKKFKHVAGAAVSHADSYIRKKLKMDKTGFLAAILVQQKQVDQLISASPRERAEVIERLTGVLSVTRALVQARQNHNTLRKVLQHTTIDDDEHEKLEKQLETLTKELEEKTNSKESETLKQDELARKFEELSIFVRNSEESESKVSELQQEIDSLKIAIKLRTDELAKVTKRKDDQKAKLSKMSLGSDLKDVEDKLSKARSTLREKERIADSAASKIVNLQRTNKSHSDFIEKSSVQDLSTAEESLVTWNKKLSAAKNKLALLRQAESEERGQIKKVNSAIAVVSSEKGSCPTCLQHIEDPESAVRSLEAEKEQYLEALEENIASSKAVIEAIEKIEVGVSKFNQLIYSLKDLEENKLSIEELTSVKNEAEAEIVVLESEVTGFEKIHRSAKYGADTKAEYERLRSEAVSISDIIEKDNARVQKLTTQLSGISTDGSNLKTLRKKLDDVSERKTTSLLKLSELTEKVSVLEAKVTFMNERIDESNKARKKYRELLESVEVSGTSVEVIEEFRESRIRTSVPIVSTYASDLLSQFTEGKFVQLKLDEKFNATVVLPNGAERAVGLLSGGELSAAAISLRLAISMLLNSGNSSNMIILDEVLVSQDDERAEKILTTIKDVCKGQVLMISHGATTAEIADKVVEL